MKRAIGGRFALRQAVPVVARDFSSGGRSYVDAAERGKVHGKSCYGAGPAAVVDEAVLKGNSNFSKESKAIDEGGAPTVYLYTLNDFQ